MSSSFRQHLATLPQGLRTRFAPSPSGFLHLGHVASAIFVWGIAEAIQGRVIIRIEDHDRQRCRPEFSQAILEDLRWLGLLDLASTEPEISSQSTHVERYLQSWEKLDHLQLVYPCSCSRKDLSERLQKSADASRSGGGGDLAYDGYCLAHPPPPSPSLRGSRVRLPPTAISFHDMYLGPQVQIPATQCGDLLLRERNGNWTYNFCVVVDDSQEQIDFIIRGQDILEASGRQLQLAALLEARQARYFFHHPLIVDSEGRKLSKRYGSTSLRHLRETGMSSATLLGMAAAAVGLLESERELEASEIGELFTWTN